MAINSVKDLFIEELRDVYHAEKQALKAMPKVAKKISNESLQDLLKQHQEETSNQVSRIEQVFEILEVPKRGKTCHAMEGLIEEAVTAMSEIEDDAVLDVAMIGAIQKMEHYEIASYGTLVELARSLGHEEAVDLLEQTLEEEKSMDLRLSEIAKSEVNPAALADEGGDEEEDEDLDDDEDMLDDDEEEPLVAEPEEEPAPAPTKGRKKAKAS